MKGTPAVTSRRECRVEYTWIDDHRDPKVPANRKYPSGLDANCAAAGATKLCKAELPYPAKRCGWYVVKCRECGQHLMISTAGRADDPRSVTFECKRQEG